MKRKPFGERLIENMKETLAALREGKELVVFYRPSLPQPPALTSDHVFKLRTGFGLTQSEFSQLMMVSTKTVQSWEQGTRTPSGTALRVMQILQSPEMLNPILEFRAARAGQKRKAPFRKISARN